MANYKTHKNIGVMVAAISLGIISVLNQKVNLFEINIVGMLLFFLFAVAGSLLPDIDLKASRPSKILFRFLSLFILFIYILNFTVLKDKIFPILKNFNLEMYSTPILLVSILVVPILLSKIIMSFQSLTHHRGLIHSVPFAILSSLIMVKLLSNNTQSSILEYNLFGYLFHVDIIFIISGYLIGFVTHLILDEAYSVDFSNKRMKKSFGTAVSFYSNKNPIGYIVMYVGIVYFLNDVWNIL